LTYIISVLSDNSHQPEFRDSNQFIMRKKRLINNTIISPAGIDRPQQEKEDDNASYDNSMLPGIDTMPGTVLGGGRAAISGSIAGRDMDGSLHGRTG
jgi:hypothetical protein